MLFLEKGDYKSIMQIIEKNQEIEEDERIFLRILVSSDPKSPYFDMDTVKVNVYTLKNLFPDSAYNAQVSSISSLAEEHFVSKEKIEKLNSEIFAINEKIAELKTENNNLKELLVKKEKARTELIKRNEQLVAEEKKLKEELEEVQKRLEAIKEIDLKTKTGTDE